MTMCMMPATGRTTILDCPNATLAMMAQRSLGRSERLTSLPSLMLLLI